MLISFALIFILGIAFGKIFEKIGLPKFIGMILIGAVVGSNGLNLVHSSVLQISSNLRQIALIIVLTRAGLSLNISDLKEVGRPAILMSFVPAIFEIIGVCILSLLLFEISLMEALLIGTVIAAVSPAVIVPRMINILNEGYKKAPVQTILAGASVDDIFVIVMFTTFLSFLQGEEVSFVSIINIPISIIMGAIVGIVFAKIIYYLVKNMSIELQIILILSTSFIAVYLEEFLPISGLISIMVMGMYFYRKDLQFSKNLALSYNKLWAIFEILLFVLVGTIIDINYIMMFGTFAIITIFFSLFFRMFGVYISLIRSGFSNKEKLFCAFSYLPKATVQASIGTIPLTLGLECGNLVFTLAILSIIITAPLGAILIDKNYKSLLEKN